MLILIFYIFVVTLFRLIQMHNIQFEYLWWFTRFLLSWHDVFFCLYSLVSLMHVLLTDAWSGSAPSIFYSTFGLAGL